MQKVINGSTVRYWACINFSRSVQESAARGFCQQLVQMCQISGMVKFQILAMPCYLSSLYLFELHSILFQMIITYLPLYHDQHLTTFIVKM